MARTKKPSSRKRRKTVLPALGAGMSLAMVGGASATTTAPTTDVSSQKTNPVITLHEEELSDVSLGTFYVFDRENDPTLGQGMQRSTRLRRRRSTRLRLRWSTRLRLRWSTRLPGLRWSTRLRLRRPRLRLRRLQSLRSGLRSGLLVWRLLRTLLALDSGGLGLHLLIMRGYKGPLSASGHLQLR